MNAPIRRNSQNLLNLYSSMSLVTSAWSNLKWALLTCATCNEVQHLWSGVILVRSSDDDEGDVSTALHIKVLEKHVLVDSLGRSHTLKTCGYFGRI